MISYATSLQSLTPDQLRQPEGTVDPGLDLSYMAKELYNPDDPTTVIKADLDYVATHWDAPTFDLWEEVNGTHFYTRLVTARRGSNRRSNTIQ